MATEEDISIDSDGNLVVKRREVQKDISVNEEEVEVGGSGVDLESFESELEDAMSSALESMEEVNIEADADRVDDTDSGGTEETSDTQAGTDGESGGGSGEDQSEPDLTVEEAVEQSKSIIEEEGITPQNWNTFASAWDERGVGDSSFLSDVWNELKDRNILVSDGSDGESDTGEDGGDEEESQDPDSGGRDGTDIADSVDEEDVFLLVSPGDEASDAALDQFADMIESGEIKTVNTQTSTEAADMMSQADISTPPALVLETDEGFVELGEEMEEEQQPEQSESDGDSDGGEEDDTDGEEDDEREDSGEGELPITPEEAAEKWPTANRNAFNSGCLSGDSEPQLGMGVCSQLWSEIQERGLGEAGDGGDDESDSSGGGGGGGKFSKIAPDDVDESEVEDAYLVYKDDTEAGQQALDQFSGFISDGVLKKAEFFNSPTAGTIRNEIDDLSTPALVLDMGGGDFVEVN